jgi:UDP-N-acetylglucosamine 2-epimerase
MRVLIVGEGPDTSPPVDDLDAEGVELERRPDDRAPAGGRREIAAIASDLRELEHTLSAQAFDAVLVVSDSTAALAAVIVATKLGVPVASLLAPGEPRGEGSNARVIHRLAGAELAPDAAAIRDWARDGYPARA